MANGESLVQEQLAQASSHLAEYLASGGVDSSYLEGKEMGLRLVLDALRSASSSDLVPSQVSSLVSVERTRLLDHFQKGISSSSDYLEGKIHSLEEFLEQLEQGVPSII